MEFELIHFEAAAEHFNHYATGTINISIATVTFSNSETYNKSFTLTELTETI